MTRKSLYLLCGVAAAVALAAGGCTRGTGGGTSPAGTGNSATAPAAAAWRDFVTCARDHGQQSMPDPVVAADGTATFPSVQGFDEKTAYEAVREPCGTILNRLPAGANPWAPQSFSPQQLDALRRYVQCLRDHGLTDMPDPGPNGELIDPPGAGPDGPRRQVRDAARGACDQILLDFP